MSVDAISQIIEAKLPGRYEPLLLTFYGDNVQTIASLIVFGTDSETDFCLGIDDGFVYSVDPKHELPIRFVNTSAECLARFLAAHLQYVVKVSGIDDEEKQLQLVRLLKEQLLEIDAMAFAESENWWATVLEQMEDGML